MKAGLHQLTSCAQNDLHGTMNVEKGYKWYNLTVANSTNLHYWLLTLTSTDRIKISMIIPSTEENNRESGWIWWCSWRYNYEICRLSYSILTIYVWGVTLVSLLLVQLKFGNYFSLAWNTIIIAIWQKCKEFKKNKIEKSQLQPLIFLHLIYSLTFCYDSFVQFYKYIILLLLFNVAQLEHGEQWDDIHTVHFIFINNISRNNYNIH